MKVLVMGLLVFILNIPLAIAESNTYDRVMKSRIIECGYFIESPFTVRDETTGKFSGLSVELIETIAQELNLKVKWKEQVSFASFPQDLNRKKYDMVCGSVFVLPRSGQMDYTNSYAYVPMLGYVKSDNDDLDKPFDDIDWSKVTIAGLDGEGATTAAQRFIPEANMHILPQLSSVSEMLMTVTTGKSDIGFVLPSVFEQFDTQNIGKLKKANLDRPLSTYDVSFGIARGQDEFKAMINNTLRQLIASGELQALFKKHDPKGHFKAPALN